MLFSQIIVVIGINKFFTRYRYHATPTNPNLTSHEARLDKPFTATAATKLSTVNFWESRTTQRPIVGGAHYKVAISFPDILWE